MSKGIVLSPSSFDELARVVHEKAFNACGADGRLKVPGSLELTMPRRGLFNAMYSYEGFSKFGDLVREMGKEDGGRFGALNGYFAARWYALLVFILAVLTLVACVVMASTASARVRRCLLECFGRRGRETRNHTRVNAQRESGSHLTPVSSDARDRQMRSTLLRIGRRMRKGLLGLAVICFLCISILVGFGVKASVDLGTSIDTTSCNMWLELDGYFNGAANIKPDIKDAEYYPTSDNTRAPISDYLLSDAVRGNSVSGETLLGMITNNWAGSQSLKAGLNDLDAMTALTPQNPIYVNFTTGRQALQQEIEGRFTVLKKYLQTAIDLGNDYDGMLAKVNSIMNEDPEFAHVGNWDTSYDWKLALKTVYDVKASVFRDEVADSLNKSWTIIDGLIEKYAGQRSELMTKANKAVKNSMETVLQIDLAISHMYDVWNSHGGLLAGLAITQIIFVSLFFLCALLASGLTVYLSINLNSNKVLRGKRTPTNSTSILSASFAPTGRKLWRSAFVLGFVSLGLACLNTGFSFFTAVAGNDACHLADSGLLDDGDWSLMGDKILNPTVDGFDFTRDDSAQREYVPGTAQVNMRHVLDVCLKRDGNGNVGARLGLDASIAEVTDDVDRAIDDVDATRESLLLRKSRYMRVEVVGFVMQELLRGLIHVNNFRNPTLLSRKVLHTFSEHQQINWENHTSADQGRRVMLSFTPTWPDALNVLNQGFFYGLSSLPDAYTLLNDVSDVAFKANPSSKLPRFCGPLARQRKLACSYYKEGEDARPIVDLGDKTINNAKMQEWVGFASNKYALDADVPTYGDYGANIGERTYQLMAALRYVERSGSLTTKDLKWREDEECLHEGSSDTTCFIDEVRFKDAGLIAEVYWPNVLEQYLGMVSDVDAFVDEMVIPSTRSMINKGNDLMGVTNCQFQRGVIEYAVISPLCGIAFPATAELSLISFIAAVIMFVLVFLLWSYKPIFDSEQVPTQGYAHLITDSTFHQYDHDDDYVPIPVRRQH